MAGMRKAEGTGRSRETEREKMEEVCQRGCGGEGERDGCKVCQLASVIWPAVTGTHSRSKAVSQRFGGSP